MLKQVWCVRIVRGLLTRSSVGRGWAQWEMLHELKASNKEGFSGLEKHWLVEGASTWEAMSASGGSIDAERKVAV